MGALESNCMGCWSLPLRLREGEVLELCVLVWMLDFSSISALRFPYACLKASLQYPSSFLEDFLSVQGRQRLATMSLGHHGGSQVSAGRRVGPDNPSGCYSIGVIKVTCSTVKVSQCEGMAMVH
jgi:hypothetical protein